MLLLGYDHSIHAMTQIHIQNDREQLIKEIAPTMQLRTHDNHLFIARGTFSDVFLY